LLGWELMRLVEAARSSSVEMFRRLIMVQSVKMRDEREWTRVEYGLDDS
jgi:hypothetical protein